MSKTTQSGFPFELDKEVLNDWEFVECIDDLDEHPERIVRVAKKLLGSEQYKQLKKHCTVNGKVQLDRMTTEITEILSSEDETKNS